MNGRFALMMLMGLGASVPEPVQVYDAEPRPTRDGRYRQRTPHGVFYGDTVEDVEREIREAAEVRRKEEENAQVQAFLAAERKRIEREATTSTRDPAGQDRIRAAIAKRERKAARLRGEK